MKKYMIVSILPLVFLVGSSVDPLQYIDHSDRMLTSYAEWHARQTAEPFSFGACFLSDGASARDGLVDIVVYAPIYTGIMDSLSVYISDLISEGYTVRVDTVRGATAFDVRNHFIMLSGSNLVGAVLIGNVPFAWYEEDDGQEREEFPIDLYFMDLNGIWVDADTNGLYEYHTGDRAPEIWVGRIYASSMTWGNEIALVNNYLSKIHKYRNGGYTIPHKALAYVDDPWFDLGDCSLSDLYDTVDVVIDFDVTTASDFRARFIDPYEWVHVCSHGSAWGSAFAQSGGFAGTVFNFEIWHSDPSFLFVNIFGYGSSRFFEENYLAGTYLYGPSMGLLTLGSTKAGSMLYLSDFYSPLGEGMSVGEAFKEWFAQWGITDPSWFYGMCICGDPLLKPLETAYRNRQRANPVSYEYSLSWSVPEPVDTDPETDGYVATMTDGIGRVWSAWVSGRSQTNGRTEICTSYRQDGVWISPETVNPYANWDFFPALISDHNGIPILSWARCYEGNYDIFLSSYNGSHWVIPYRLSSRATDAFQPSMTVDGGNRLWVTFERWNHLNGDIYCKFFQGGWQPMFAVTVGEGNDYKPRMATDSTGKAWTVWTSDRYDDNANICVKDYNAVSGHWENLYGITSHTAQDQDPAICVDGSGVIWVAWTTWRNNDSDIYASTYSNGTWSVPHAVTQDPGRDEQCELVVDQDGNVWCIWQSDRFGDWEVLATFYYGTGWQEVMNVSNSTFIDILPSATLDDSGNIWVLFQTDRNGNWDIYASSMFADAEPPQVLVIEPNGGETWFWNNVYTVEWHSSDNAGIDSLNVELSLDGGITYPIVIAHIAGNDSMFDYLVPEIVSSACRVRVTAYDAGGNSGSDVSDNVFEIGEYGIEEESEILRFFAVDVTTSNPFTGALSCEIMLPSASPVKFMIYDVEGRLVDDINEPVLGPGIHTFILGHALPAGVYFVHVMTGDYQKSAKVIKLK
ncbi:MAG: T9SS type A sorting domain-containing protein [candidate division WOR-3 bacterium]|nr:MAG: T9SS type A sorting domain-containing protein [candidate division WOR-3 bacterium]